MGHVVVNTVRPSNPKHEREFLMSNEETKTMESLALSAIHEEILKLLAMPLPPDIEPRIALIESICRYRHDVRSDSEKLA